MSDRKFLNNYIALKGIDDSTLVLKSYIDFLNEYITLGNLDKATKLKLMDYIDILNHKKVELELASGKKTKEEIEKTAKRFRKKAQSAVSG